MHGADDDPIRPGGARPDTRHARPAARGHVGGQPVQRGQRQPAQQRRGLRAAPAVRGGVEQPERPVRGDPGRPRYSARDAPAAACPPRSPRRSAAAGAPGAGPARAGWPGRGPAPRSAPAPGRRSRPGTRPARPAPAAGPGVVAAISRPPASRCSLIPTSSSASSASLPGKCRYSAGPLTPTAAPRSAMLTPWKPRWANSCAATARICSRRPPPGRAAVDAVAIRHSVAGRVSVC